MIVDFATCERGKALDYLRIVLPNYEIEDSVDSAEKLLDLVEKDIVRVQDPFMHGNRIAIILSNNFKEELREKVTRVCQSFQLDPGIKKEESK